MKKAFGKCMCGAVTLTFDLEKEVFDVCHCGTQLFYHLKKNGFRNVPWGLVEISQHFKFNLQIFIDRKPEGYQFANETEKMTEKEIFDKYV